MSLVLFFLRKPRLGMEALRLGAQEVQTSPRSGQKRGGAGTEARRGGGQQGR